MHIVAGLSIEESWVKIRQFCENVITTSTCEISYMRCHYVVHQGNYVILDDVDCMLGKGTLDIMFFHWFSAIAKISV